MGAQERVGSVTTAPESSWSIPPDDGISMEDFLLREGRQQKRSKHAPDTDPRVDGAKFIFDALPLPEPVWGDREGKVIAARGEGTMVTGPTGIGKTTLMQQVALKRIGIGDPNLLGYEVTRDDRKVLYLALDRPRQIARMWRRMVAPEDYKILQERLVVCVGALPFALTYDKPGRLAEYALEIGAGMIVVDSYKDLASNLSDEQTGALINRIVQDVVVADIEWLGGHHQRKAQAKQNPKPNTIADVYGSGWLTAGLGSVIGLWGTAGDSTVEWTHLKIPAETVHIGAVTFDHSKGTVHVADGPIGHDASSAHQRTLINALMGRPLGDRITNTDAQEILGLKESATRKVLQAMVENKTLTEHGDGAVGSPKTWSLSVGQRI
jgi:KaiC/GvpD/RAD55 family RecA-like ATPase